MSGLSVSQLSETPIQKLRAFSCENSIYIKRDDLLPFCFGGNKARIARCFMEDAIRKKATCMVAYGSTRSNLSRVLACACAAAGIRCIVISPSDDDGGRFDSFNSEIVSRLDAEIVPCVKGQVRQVVAAVLQQLREEGERPYYIYGDETGSGNEAIPVQAYVDVFEEICRQERSMGVAFDYVFLATGTGMTQAGLLAGKAKTDRRVKIVGISVARNREAAEAGVNRHLAAYLPDSYPMVEVCDSYLHGGYGKSDDRQRLTMEKLMRSEGIQSDETYVGKAFDGMLRYLGEKHIEGSSVLFLHTGGTPLYFDYLRGNQ